MKIKTFDLERIQSLYENTVPYNLTESGFHPYSLKDLFDNQQLIELMQVQLGYGQTNGAIPLREAITALYPDQGADNCIVTNGSSEANFIACHSLLEPGDELLMMVPNYLQIWGVAEEMGVKVQAFHLIEDRQWAPNLDELELLVTPKTKMIALCNPNNPTGYILSIEEMNRIVAIAEKVGAWIYCDEVYRGAELNGKETSSFIGLYDKVVVTGGLSKAYALPGLRLGWLVGPKDLIADTWKYHDYTSISTGILSQKVAELVLRDPLRLKILERNRSLLRTNLKVVQDWIDHFPGGLRFVPPQGGGMAFLAYEDKIDSLALSTKLREEHGLFIAAGSWFGMEGFVRLGIGAETTQLKIALSKFEI